MGVEWILLLILGASAAAMGDGTASGDAPLGNEEPPFGPADDTVLKGTEGTDVIIGLDKAEFIETYGGDDIIETGGNPDGVFAGAGDDLVIYGDPVPHGGDDAPGSGEFEAEAHGGDGADTLTGGAGSEILHGGGPNSLFAAIFSEAGFAMDLDPDVLNGGGGNDALVFGAGDVARGGTGQDTFEFDATTVAEGRAPGEITDWETGEAIVLKVARDASSEVALGAEGDDAVVLVEGRPVLVVRGAGTTLGLDDLTILEAVVFPPVPPTPSYEGTGRAEALTGSSLDSEWFDALAGNDTVASGTGSDVVFAGKGNDLIETGNNDARSAFFFPGENAFGGDGADRLTGGTGAQSLFATGPDNVTELFLGLGPVLGGETPLFQNDRAADVLDGKAGDDLLVFSGLDTATGGAGDDDFMVVDPGTDVAIITDFEAGEAISLTFATAPGASPIVTVEAEGSDAIVSVDGARAIVAVGAAGVLGLGDITVDILDGGVLT